MFQFSDYDPLTAALRPPSGETPEQQAEREAEEAQAIEISNRIDAEIKAARQAMKKNRKPIRVLVLGQSMSGKHEVYYIYLVSSKMTLSSREDDNDKK